MWDNGFNSAEDQEKLTVFWCMNYFGDAQYQKIGGKPDGGWPVNYAPEDIGL